VIISYRYFWFASLLSNISAGAQSVGVMWLLGDDHLQSWVLITFQFSNLAGTLGGISLGARLINKLGFRRTVVLSSIMEFVFCIIVAASSYAPSGHLSMMQAYIVAFLSLGGPFAAGIGGPAWISLISKWPGSHSQTKQILYDSAQFQIGRFLGPIFGGALMLVTRNEVQISSIANAATYACIAVILFLTIEFADRVQPAPKKALTTSGMDFVKSKPLWGIAALAFSADSSRIFLARLIQQNGNSSLIYSISIAVLAVSAAGAAFMATKRAHSELSLTQIGLIGITLGLLIWTAVPMIGAIGWIIGAFFVGASVSISYASLLSRILSEFGQSSKFSGISAAMSIRTIFSALGGIVLAIFVPVFGSAALLFSAWTTTGAGILLAKERENFSELQELT